MASQLLDGKALAKRMQQAIAERVENLKARDLQARIASVLVAGDDASAWYQRNQQKAARKVGIEYDMIELPGTTTAAELGATLDRLNADPGVSGIILQVPLPKGLDGDAFQQRIAPHKDIEGVTLANLGRLVRGGDDLVPCTARAAVELVVDAGIPIEGRHCVVLGRSVIVGKPLALMMLDRHAHVTVCHSRTPNLPELCRSADILMCAVGRKAGMVTGDWVKPGACVVDIAIIPTPDGGITGDVDSASVGDVAGWLAPVPGGVGPVTVGMLLRNACIACEQNAAR